MNNYAELLTQARFHCNISEGEWYLKITYSPQEAGDEERPIRERLFGVHPNPIIALSCNGEFSDCKATFKNGAIKKLSTRSFMKIVRKYCEKRQLERIDLQDPQRLTKQLLHILEYLAANETEVSKHTYSINFEKLYKAVPEDYINEFDFLNTMLKVLGGDLPQLGKKSNGNTVLFSVVDSASAIEGGMYIKFNDNLFENAENV
ncbi:hypothetical protein QMP26_41395 (plasmid) [Enterocloster clostridioformis]